MKKIIEFSSVTHNFRKNYSKFDKINLVVITISYLLATIKGELLASFLSFNPLPACASSKRRMVRHCIAMKIVLAKASGDRFLFACF